jgi:hypothetical protein
MRIGSVRKSAPGDGASLPGQAGGRASALPLAALCLASLLVLGGCTLSDLWSADINSGATAPPPTPRATATPWGGAPHQLPSGWSVYYAPHFTIALPPQWRVEPVVIRPDHPEYLHMRYNLYPSADWPVADSPRVSVDEWDERPAAEIRREFCAPTAGYEASAVAGLPMRFSQGLGATGLGRYDAFWRDWTFISDHGTVYELSVNDHGFVNDVDSYRSASRAVVETFAPQYTTWGCA